MPPALCLELSILCISFPPYINQDRYYQLLHLPGGALLLIMCVARVNECSKSCVLRIASKGVAYQWTLSYWHAEFSRCFLGEFNWRQRGIGF